MINKTVIMCAYILKKKQVFRFQRNRFQLNLLRKEHVDWIQPQNLSRTVAAHACGGNLSRPALHSCGFWFPTCVRESVDTLPVQSWMALTGPSRLVRRQVDRRQSRFTPQAGKAARALCVL